MTGLAAGDGAAVIGMQGLYLDQADLAPDDRDWRAARVDREPAPDPDLAAAP